jgi:anti-sigma B factor antagonist
METAVGVFSSRERAEQAVRELREGGVPEQSIVFLTCSETDAKIVSRELGGSSSLTLGAWSLPDLGAVFALGFGAAALLGLPGVNLDVTVGPAAGSDTNVTRSSVGDESEDASFFREVLKAGRSLIVVRTDSNPVAITAGTLLDRLGMGMQGKAPVPAQISTRQIADVAVVEISGRITLGEGNVLLREAILELTRKGIKKIVLRLNGVNHLDSSGVGELVRAHATICKGGGNLKLAEPSKRVRDLLDVTKLAAVFDIHDDEASAISSFGSEASARAIA